MLIRKLKYLCIPLIVILSIFQIKKLITNIQTSNLYFINCDPLFSQNLRFQIIDFINEKLKNKTPSEFWKLLKNQFPVIQSITMRKKNPDIISVNINSVKPIYAINKNLIFGQNNNLYPIEYFTQHSTQSLEEINTNEKPDNNNFLMFINNINKELYDN